MLRWCRLLSMQCQALPHGTYHTARAPHEYFMRAAMRHGQSGAAHAALGPYCVSRKAMVDPCALQQQAQVFRQPGGNMPIQMLCLVAECAMHNAAGVCARAALITSCAAMLALCTCCGQHWSTLFASGTLQYIHFLRAGAAGSSSNSPSSNSSNSSSSPPSASRGAASPVYHSTARGMICSLIARPIS